MFKVGQKVVCIHTTGDAIKDNIYIVKSLTNCICGKEYIGHTEINSSLPFYCTCGKKLGYTNILNCYSYRFRPLDETFATEVLEQIKEQIEQEELVTI